MPIQTEEDLRALPREPSSRCLYYDRDVRRRIFARMKSDPDADGAEIEYLEELAKHLEAWR
jgi:hypothetical protein